MREDAQKKILSWLQIQNYAEIERFCLHELGLTDTPDPEILFHLGNAARMMGKVKPALVAFEAASKLAPEDFNLLQACASCHQALQNHTLALQYMQQAENLAPENPIVLANIGAAMEKAERPQDALSYYDRALALDSKNLIANINRGNLLYRMSRKQDALAHYERAVELLPAHVGLLYNLAGALLGSYQYQQALESCDKGLSIDPTHSHLIFLKGMVLSCLQRYEEAQALLTWARIIEPNVVKDFAKYFKNLPSRFDLTIDARGLYLEAMYEAQTSCFWTHRHGYIETLQRIAQNSDELSWLMSGVDNGFRILSLELDVGIRNQILSTISTNVLNQAKADGGISYFHQRKVKKRIRVAYLSPDFRNHATAFLTRQIFGLHDRGLFEIYTYSLHQGKSDDYYTQHITATSDQFLDVSKMSPREIANRIYEDEIDILVDLAGYTSNSRTDVMAMRPAPVQFQYLGFAATTMGADFIDYVIVDKQLCLDGKAYEFKEYPIRLPHTIYPYDNETSHKPTALARHEYNLPDDVFVFCCLNNSYKIEPVIFDRWMNILKAVPNSVLWLLGKGLDVQDNLERQAEVRGVDKSRLVFAGRVPLEQHLPRYQLANLFLDTYWHNAHTTGAEALWHGLPLITIMGEVPSARGAASILTALEMTELIVQNHDEYERLAIYYATHPVEYSAMREKLKAKRYTAPMYNTKLTVKHIEKAYQMAWERYQAGLPPAAFDVPENTDPELRKSIH